MHRARTCLALLLLAVAPSCAFAGNGPFGIDHRLHYDNSGIWKRSHQNVLLYGTILTVGTSALALGGDDPLGDTMWRTVDAMVATSLTTTVMKHAFRRERPRDTDNPNRWFKSGHADSFPSGEVALMSAAVTPFIATYADEHPMVYALALLPAYDAVARMKVRGHWQSDVLVGAAVGTTIGLWSARRSDSPIILGWLPGGFRVGFIHRFK
ncbi:phosphatase PAP2 family protein [Luteibacter yeojuensis]|uniref:Phosphoesterase PA-phosphatase n=1 Tax=Luteibacter yeojuensis TaxID=345309 RepID=A0A0F3KY94_9GAMM|nr:phosphatase PAP2 family protein [Luteibacter yeojuensis]KJV36188.1 phosphoesterase PA-phosphatase [Luteibacter yeojuensis]